jgi:hypothetical protein
MEPTSYKLHPWPILSPRLQIKNREPHFGSRASGRTRRQERNWLTVCTNIHIGFICRFLALATRGLVGQGRFLPMREHLISRRRVLLLAARPGPAPNAKGRQSGSGF